MKDNKKFGAIICCASNGVMNVNSLKRFIDYLSLMDYNLLELVIDDMYKIDSEPYFGYLRGGYTKEEIKEVDEYAKKKGIELVPCIQTLAHLTNLVKLPEYSNIVDVDDILLADEPKTYELIDKMFTSLEQSFSTHMVNLGFDEAFKIGRGKYFDLHGCVDHYQILLRHLNKVVDIAKKHGFKCHMWSDMFFRIGNNHEYYNLNPKLPEDVINLVPDVELCYWDYYSNNKEMYEAMISTHEKFNKELWFCGGAWTWDGFAPMSNYALQNLETAFGVVNEHKINNVIISLWGDNGHDCSYFSAIATLFAARQFSLNNFNMDDIKKKFKEIFKVSFDDFMILDLPNKSSENKDLLLQRSGCKSLLFNDCFLGIKDDALSKVDHIPFDEYAKALKDTAKRMNEFKDLYINLANLCDTLSYKAELGLKTRKAYLEDNKVELKKLLKDYKLARKYLKKFRDSLHDIWMKDNKPFGWEVHEIRLGGLSARLLECEDRIRKYLKGEIKDIPELKEKILPYGHLDCNNYRQLASVSEL